MKKEITFDELPKAVSELTEQVATLTEMVSALHSPNHDEKTLIGIDEACKVLHKAKPTVYALVRKGVIPAYKRGKKLYFYKNELIEWIESGRKRLAPSISPEEILASMRAGIRNKPKSIK